MHELPPWGSVFFSEVGYFSVFLRVGYFLDFSELGRNPCTPLFPGFWPGSRIFEKWVTFQIFEKLVRIRKSWESLSFERLAGFLESGSLSGIFGSGQVLDFSGSWAESGYLLDYRILPNFLDFWEVGRFAGFPGVCGVGLRAPRWGLCYPHRVCIVVVMTTTATTTPTTTAGTVSDVFGIEPVEATIRFLAASAPGPVDVEQATTDYQAMLEASLPHGWEIRGGSVVRVLEDADRLDPHAVAYRAWPGIDSFTITEYTH